MSPLLYLYLTKQKNRIKEYFRSPSKLIFPLAVILILLMSLFTAPSSAKGEYRSIDEFFSLVFLVYTLLFVDISKNGFSNGAAFFSMADINLIFVSPLKSARVLFYGIFGQLGRSLYMGVVILLQYTLSREYYGITLGTMAVVALGYGITAFLSQIVSMLIYILTSSSEKRVKTGKIIYGSVIAFFVIYVIIKGDVLSSLSFSGILEAVGDDVLRFMPVSGTVSFLAESVVKRNTAKAFIGVIVTVLYVVLFFLFVSRNKGDFYEDVLSSAEVTFSAITAAKESQAEAGLSRNIKKGKTGFKKGEGASAISEKHKIENRRGKLLFLGRSSFVTIGMTVAYSFAAQGDSLMAFILSLYSLLIGVSAGRWMKEITMPYIYLIPEKPFSKLLHTVKEQIPSIVFESTVLLVILYFVLSLDIIQTASMLVSRISFGVLFIGTCLIFLKITGKRPTTVVTVMMYSLLSTVFCLPAALCGFYVSFFFPFHSFLGYLITVPVNINMFIILLFCSRNIIECSE